MCKGGLGWYFEFESRHCKFSIIAQHLCLMKCVCTWVLSQFPWRKNSSECESTAKDTVNGTDHEIFNLHIPNQTCHKERQVYHHRSPNTYLWFSVYYYYYIYIYVFLTPIPMFKSYNKITHTQISIRQFPLDSWLPGIVGNRGQPPGGWAIRSRCVAACEAIHEQDLLVPASMCAFTTPEGREPPIEWPNQCESPQCPVI